MKALLRASLASLVGSAALFTSSLALAAGENCYNDTDCPGAECGGEVCNWNMPNPVTNADKPYTCNPAGTDPKGQDGWCTDVDNCKCKAQGATCKIVYCSFTKASDAPAGGGGSGAGGTGSSTAGTSASTAGTSASTAGTSASAAGTSASTAGTGPAAGGSGSAPPAATADEGGCSVSAPGGSNTGLALGVGLAAIGLALSRRRR